MASNFHNTSLADKGGLSAALGAAAAVLAIIFIPMTAHAESADAVKAFAALPDWSGVWEPVGGTLFECCSGENANRGGGRGGGGARAGAPGAAPAAGGAAPAAAPAAPPPMQRDHPPFKPDWEARYVKFLNDVVWPGKDTDMITNCFPPAFPRAASFPFGRQYIIRPEEVVFLAERNPDRFIFTDGRPHPKNLIPTFEGHSIGHWEGQTLVIDTVGIKGGVPIDRWGLVLGDHMHIVEHVHLVAAGEPGYNANIPTLQDDLTIEEPDSLTKPWNVTRTYRKDVKDKFPVISNTACRESQRNPIVNGQTTILLPGDPGYTGGHDLYPAEYAKFASMDAYSDASSAGK